MRVADFGIAKAALRTVETRSGTLKGKVSYMSPEQVTGKFVDRRSDVFALGIVLYELATAKRLFMGDNDFLTMSAIVGDNNSVGYEMMAGQTYRFDMTRNGMGNPTVCLVRRGTATMAQTMRTFAINPATWNIGLYASATTARYQWLMLVKSP